MFKKKYAIFLSSLLTVNIVSGANAFDLNAEYNISKNQCLSSHGLKCDWSGCTGNNDPKEIVQSARKEALLIVNRIVNSNIASWWDEWWGWTPPDNTHDYELLVTVYQKFMTCDIDETIVLFPDLDDAERGAQLSQSAIDRINLGFANVREYAL